MSYRKVVVSGNVIEVYEMDIAPFMGDKSGDRDKDDYKPLDIPLTHEETIDRNLDERERARHERENRTQERRQQTTRDARNKVRRLALANFGRRSKFMTLTFKENITDIDKANKIFKYFIQKKLKPLCETIDPDFKMKYIAVLEFQERGAVHYHMIANLPYIPHEKLLKLWKCSCGDGAVNIQAIEHVDNVGAYLVKYMMKNAGDERLQGKKMYMTSRGLDKPKEYKGKSAELILQTYNLGTQKKEVFTNSYTSEYLGNIDYKEYNLDRQ